MKAERLRKLYALGILDTLEEQAYDDLTKLAAEICQTPIALVSLIDSDRQWFKSHHGLDARETPREVAFCAHATLNDDVFVVEDSSQDERFFDDPLATGGPLVKFYAGAPLIMSDKQKVGTLCVIGNEARTITADQKEALARQVVSQLELRLKIKELELLDHAKDEFIATVSHELRTPLTGVYGSLSLLQNNRAGLMDKQQKNLIAISYRNSKRLLDLVNEILDITKIEAEKFSLQKEEINIVALIKKSIELNEPFCKLCDSDITLRFSEKINDIKIFGDEARLLQVVSNFISNAAKFSHKEDVIQVNLIIENQHVIVAVTDHGPGIPDDEKASLFVKFKQLNTNINNKLPGSGLGLFISKNIIELHQGTIGFDSIPDEKTTFYFKLPLIK